MMPDILLRLSEAARVLVSEPHCICWMTESREGIWPATHVGTLASLLEAPRTVAALLERFPEGEREHVARLLKKMLARGLLESISASAHIAQLCRETGIAPHLEERDRWKKGATICGLSAEIEAKILAEVLAADGVTLATDGGLTVVAVRDYLDPRLSATNRGPWMPVKLAGEEVWIGPIFVSGRTACWRCLELRLRERAWLSSQIAPNGGALWKPQADENRIRAAAEFAAQEVTRWMLESDDTLEGSLWSFQWGTMRAERHLVARRPSCPHCGESIRPRSAGPQELPNLAALASPITGVVRRLERRDLAPNPPVFTYGAVYNVALPPAGLRIPGAILQPGVCSGRGWSTDEAKAACLAEGVERYSIQFRGDERRIVASYKQLGDAAIHPNKVLLFSERQLAARAEWNRVHGPADLAPEPFDESEQIEWIPGRSLTRDCARYLAMALASYYYRPPGTRWIADADSSGCAAGATADEAILRGLMELVERDSLGIWWFNRIARPHYDWRTFVDDACRRVCAELDAQGWDVWAEEIGTDLGIPVFVALAVRNGSWIYGSAAHPGRDAALRKAVAELWQLSKAPPRTGWVPASRAEERLPFNGEPAEARVDPKHALEDCCALIARAGHEVVIFDMTRPEIDFPVMRVVAPGLRSKHPRFAPGRLYDVPVRLGWLDRARREEDLPVQSA